MKILTTKLLLFSIAAFFCGFYQAQTMTVTLSGSGNFIVPCGVSSITINCWGGGGAGQGDNTNNTIGGGGGGSGAFCSSVLAVTPGQSIAYSVGAGGTGNSTTTFSAAQNGAASTFGGLAAGGGSGGNGVNGGAGGTASGGTTNTNGAAGANRSAGAGGAGGNAPGGGAGGAGGADAAAGTDGTAPGGGGGGAGDANSVVVTISKASGNGGSGRITVSYAFITAGNDQNLAPCVTSGTLNATAVPVGSIGTWTCVTNCGGVSITSPTSPTSAFSGMAVPSSTTFRWTVTDDPAIAGGAGCTSTTDDVVINTLTGALCPTYCSQDADMNCASFTEAITSVIYRTINSSGTGCTETGASTIVTPGQTNSITISTVGSGTYDLSIHIDWNADGDFADAGEFILVGNDVSPGNFNSSIVVPAGAICDAAVRMRIIWNYSANTTQATACATNLTYGEIEDYTLNISCCTPNCSNGIQDCNELGVDCGGPCGSPCAGVPSCTNSIQDQDEVGVDCGGLICAPCGTPCSTFSGAACSSPAGVGSGGVVDATSGPQTISTCVNVTYSNRGTNWLHGVFVNTASTGFVSSGGVGALPEPNYSSIGTTYRWRALSNNFTGNTSGNSITQDGWFVVTGAADNNPGDNLGWPDGAGTTFGPFCFETVVSCDGLDGDVNAFINFQTTGDSYSGSWTNIDCGRETSFGANAFIYTLRCPSVLPVELLNFQAKFVGRMVKVSWSTLSEHNTDYFEVYKSNDGTFYEKIETVQAAGNSSFQRDYASYDVEPSNKITYYKIRQYDINGDKNETKIFALITPLMVQDIAVVPNPVSAVSSVAFTASSREMNQVHITDVSGKIILQEEMEVNEGANVFSFDTNDLNEGIYFLELRSQTESKKVKFIKSKN